MTRHPNDPSDLQNPCDRNVIDDRLSHSEEYFRAMYGSRVDPWGFDRRWYERRKQEATLAALPRLRYRHGLEPGCANGTLTERLANRCDRLTAFDAIPDVVERAARRLPQSEVTVLRASFPTFWPGESVDLIVWSEIAYYLTEEGRHVAAEGVGRWLEDGGHLVAVHYLGETNYPSTGTAVGEWIDAFPELERLSRWTDPMFEIGVWERT